MFGYLLFILIIKNCILISLSWEDTCPEWCVCQTIHWIDTSVARYMKQPPLQPKPPTSTSRRYQNEILDKMKNNEEDVGELFKSATCILQPGIEIATQLKQLNNNLEILVLLQSKGSGSLELKPEDVISLEKLKGLEARSSSQSEPIIIQGDALSQLKNLEYLILEGASLRGHPSLGNRATPIGVASLIDLANLANNELRPLLGENPSLEYLTPNEDDENFERLPFKEYQRQLQMEGLSAFSKMSLLRLLILENCGIEDLTWDMLNGLSALEHLSLARNHLYYIPELAFYATPKLRTLSLADNQILNVQSTSLVGLLDLERLDLSGNNISHLSELSLPPFPRLKHADLTNNPIEAVFASTFEVMNSTQSLALGSPNSSLHLVPDAFRGLTELLTLRIDRLEIPQLIREMFRGMPKLQELFITGSINHISFDAFLEVRKLITLILSNSQISTLSMDAFYGLDLLEKLDLSNNQLEILPPGIFQELVSLRELELQNNRLKELPTDTISRLSAKMIRLDGNPWECTCAMFDWSPLTIGRVRVSENNNKFIDLKKNVHYSESTANLQSYRFDRRITPLCNSPEKFRNWSIFQAVRKGLRCDKHRIAKEIIKKLAKESKIKYSFQNQKIEKYRKSTFQNKSTTLINNKNFNKSHEIINEINNVQQTSNNSIEFQNNNASFISKIGSNSNNNFNLSEKHSNKLNNNMILYPSKQKSYIDKKPEENIFSKNKHLQNQGIDIYSEIRKIMNKENSQRGIDKYKKLKKAFYVRTMKEQKQNLNTNLNI